MANEKISITKIKVKGYAQVLSWRINGDSVNIEVLYANGKQGSMLKSLDEWELMKIEYQLIATLSEDQITLFKEFADKQREISFKDGQDSMCEE